MKIQNPKKNKKKTRPDVRLLTPLRLSLFLLTLSPQTSPFCLLLVAPRCRELSSAPFWFPDFGRLAAPSAFPRSVIVESSAGFCSLLLLASYLGASPVSHMDERRVSDSQTKIQMRLQK